METLTVYVEWAGPLRFGRRGILRIYDVDPIRYVWVCSTQRYWFNRRLHLQGFLKGPNKEGFKAIQRYCLDHNFASAIWEAITPKSVTHVELFADTLKSVRHRTHDVEEFLANVKRRPRKETVMRFLRDLRGTTAVEDALIAALILVAAMTAFTAMGGSVRTLFDPPPVHTVED